MTNSMVERVARSLAAHDGADDEELEILFVEPKYKILERERDRYLAKARAAIAAMREPPQNVVNAMAEHVDEDQIYTSGLEAWQAAIDEALK